jgi:hypothetical protein
MMSGEMIMSDTIAEEVARLTAVERDTRLRYIEALKHDDSPKTRLAAGEWRKAADTLTEFVLKHPLPYKSDG